MSDNPTEEKHIAKKADQEICTEPGAGGRFQKQIEFMLEADKLKQVSRKTILLDRSRLENSAEHCWHIALMVSILSEYAKDQDIDFNRVIKMLLVHDLVEIDAGDTYCYDEQGIVDQAHREQAAAERTFGILPVDQAADLRSLWDEFEARLTPESKFANALDRFQPFLHNYFTEGQVWLENGIKSSQVVARMEPVNDGAPALWEYIKTLIDEAVGKGYLAK